MLCWLMLGVAVAAQLNRLERRNLDLEDSLAASQQKLNVARETQAGKAEDLATRLSAAADRTTAALRDAAVNRAAAESAQAKLKHYVEEVKTLQAQVDELSASNAALTATAAGLREAAEEWSNREAAYKRAADAAAEQVSASTMWPGVVKHARNAWYLAA